jgi:hypothetical protein
VRTTRQQHTQHHDRRSSAASQYTTCTCRARGGKADRFTASNPSQHLQTTLATAYQTMRTCKPSLSDHTVNQTIKLQSKQ